MYVNAKILSVETILGWEDRGDDGEGEFKYDIFHAL
jgi:hypothetical protein